MARTRTMLFDVQSGTAYSNVTSLAVVKIDNIIAETARRALPIVVKSPGVQVQLVTATLGWGIEANTHLVGVKMQCMKTDPSSIPDSAVAPNGSNLNINIRKITSNAVSSVLTTANIVSGSISSYKDVDYNLVSGDTLYVDVTQVGTLNPGNGLKVTLYYYGGV